MITRKLIATATAFALMLTVAVPATTQADDIVETAVSAGSFNTLAAALKAAGLVEALQGEGPFTVFAPTDDAFAKLPEGTVESLLKPENKEQLIAVLTYHVVSGNVKAAQVVKLKNADTLNGQRVDIKVADGKVKVDNANVVKTDIECDNGVIHVIDSVILPSSDDIPTTAVNAGNFNTLVAAAKAAGLVDALAGDGPLTVFAPTDDAFAKLPEGTVETLLKPENRDKLAAILKYHVVSGRVYSDAALKAGQAATLQGDKIRITANDQGASVNDAKLIATDIDASNGVIHVIDSVILPSEKQSSAANPRQMIEEAVATGAHQFNEGHAAACAATYKQAMQTMLALDNHGMSDHAVKAIETALHSASHSNCSNSQAWILRKGLDTAYSTMPTTVAGGAAAQ